MSKSVQELATYVGGKVIGDANLRIDGITNLEAPQPGFITFAQDPKSFQKLEASSIACLIVTPEISQSSKTLIQVASPKLAWAKLLRLFFPVPQLHPSVSDKAFVAKTAKIGKEVTIEPFVTVSDGAVIGDHCVLRSHVFVGENVVIGDNTFLHPNVVIYRDCSIGKRVIIHAGTVIGADGFGYVATAQGQEKVPQVGNVIIEEDVELGASVTIDRATIGSTKIGKGCKLDNLVQVAHNVEIGMHTVISAQTGISGSCRIGNYVTMGGKVGVGDHVEIGDWVMVGAGAGLPTGKKIPARQIVFGQPARPYQEARKQIGAQLRAAETYEELKALRKKVTALEGRMQESGLEPLK